MKGAVCYGLEGIVHRRKLPCHFGIELDERYDPKIHDPAYNYINQFCGTEFNRDCMTWFANMVSTHSIGLLHVYMDGSELTRMQISDAYFFISSKNQGQDTDSIKRICVPFNVTKSESHRREDSKLILRSCSYHEPPKTRSKCQGSK